MRRKDGSEFGYWTEKALQIAAFYWKRPWWELTVEEINEAWESYLEQTDATKKDGQ